MRTSKSTDMKKNAFTRLFMVAAVAALTLTPFLSSEARDPDKLLVVTVTKGFRHSSIPTAEKVLQQLSDKSGKWVLDFARTDEELAAKTTSAALDSYDGVIFANTTGTLPLADPAYFIEWIKDGHAFIGMHSATDTFHDFPEFVEMIGGSFRTHGAQVTVEALNEDPAHPSTVHLGESYIVHDEIYILRNYHREKVHLLLTLDKHPNDKTPGHYPIAWNKKFGKGRMFHTSLGHREDVWNSIPYQRHITGGIEWALGMRSGASQPQNLAAKLPSGDYFHSFRPLFNGENLDGWKLRNADGNASWTAENGMLVNRISADAHGSDLVSEKVFKDFILKYEYMIPAGSNSGVYLRGRHELQILDDYDARRTTLSGNGAIYNYKAGREFISKPPGEWQSVEATIIGNLVSVKLNGVLIHENVEVPRATGGELDQNLNAPGPIMLQGDHGAIAFRNVRIRNLSKN